MKAVSLRSVLVLCVLVSCALSLTARAGDRSGDAVWGELDSYPSDIDMVAVMENPAEHLLSDAGVSSRSLLASMGVFGKTKQALGALGALFETDADGVIDEFLSGRVVVCVDSIFEHSDNPLSLMLSADSNWVVMAEVEDEAVGGLRKKLRPVARELVGGVAVYGIEQGRYALVILSKKNGHSRVMLSPKAGRGLLERVLISLGKEQGEGQPIAPSWEHGRDWMLAMRLRVDTTLDRMWELDGIEQSKASTHVRIFAGATDEGFEVSLALPMRGSVVDGRAPIGLLSGLGDDIVLAMAISAVIQLEMDQERGLSIRIREGETDQSENVLDPRGAMIVFNRTDAGSLGGAEPMGMTVLSVFEENEVDAKSMDGLIEPMLLNQSSGLRVLGATNPRMYGGMFPNAIRSHEVVDADDILTRVSWKTTNRSASSDLIFSLGGESVVTSQRVRGLDEVVSAMDAIGAMDSGIGAGEVAGNHAASSVLLSGFLRVDALLESMLETQNLLSKEMLSIVDRVEWQVVQDEGVMRGNVVFVKSLD
jgi:hypothetical protein